MWRITGPNKPRASNKKKNQIEVKVVNERYLKMNNNNFQMTLYAIIDMIACVIELVSTFGSHC